MSGIGYQGSELVVFRRKGGLPSVALVEERADIGWDRVAIWKNDDLCFGEKHN